MRRRGRTYCIQDGSCWSIGGHIDTGSKDPVNLNLLTPPKMISPAHPRVRSMSSPLGSWCVQQRLLKPSPSPPKPMLNTGAAIKPNAHISDNSVGYFVVKGQVYPKPKTPEYVMLVLLATANCTPGTWNTIIESQPQVPLVAKGWRGKVGTGSPYSITGSNQNNTVPGLIQSRSLL